MGNPTPIPANSQSAPLRVPVRVDRPASVQQSIANAAQQTSVDFDYLLAQAEVESDLNPTAKARTSSATGLYQFIESTWLGTMQRHGARFGLANVASQVGTSSNGQAYVADNGQRQAILAMRNDPQVASFMAAGLAEDNRAHLMPILGRQPDHGELYLAHFLGAGGAGRFLTELAQDPNQSAPDLFRRPAAANRSIFYKSNGSPRTLGGVMNVIDAKMSSALARVDDGGAGTFTASPIPAAPYPVPGATGISLTSGTNSSRTVPIRATGLTSSAPSTPSQAAARPPMSNILQSTFGDGGLGSLSSPEGAAQVRRAYQQLKAFGL